MWSNRFSSFLFALLPLTSASSQIQGPCTDSDPGLQWLASVLSPAAVIACRGEELQIYSTNRYWGKQYGKDAAVVVFPATALDVSYTVQATSKTPLGAGYAFVSGAHSMTNSSSSESLVIDLSYLNASKIVHDYVVDGSEGHGDKKGEPEKFTAIEYGGGATTLQIAQALNGSGWTPVSARVGSVGMGGFSTGGGVGYLAGAYGFASDRVVAVEAVLPGTGEIVLATEFNAHADLLWALKGAGLGQFGIVTRFWQRAAPEPKNARIEVHILGDDTLPQAFANTVDFFESNDDPFSVVYYTFGYFPLDLSNPTPAPGDFQILNILVTVWFDDPTPSGKTQKPAKERFAPLISNITILGSVPYAVPYAELPIIGESFFPYGSRRGFWGPQTTKISVDYLENLQKEYASYIDSVLKAGDFPAAATFTLQYMFPGMNGHLPKSDKDTAWPHAVAGHQTLFNPGWALAQNDGLAEQSSEILNQVTRAKQLSVSKPAAIAVSKNNVANSDDIFLASALHLQSQQAVVASSISSDPAVPCGGDRLCDYPNYIGTNVPGRQVWGENLPRLIAIKQKYDPECTLHTGRVLASEGCVKKGVANVFP